MKNHLPKNTLNYFSRLSELVGEKPNKNWMKDWMEQSENFKNKSEALKIIGNDVDGFLHYADKVEGKYV